MPTYDYECKKCHHKFEVFQSIKDKPLSECPQCNGEVKRLIGGGMGIIFKGNGFYTTDYKKSSSTASSSSAKAKPAAAKEESASPTESKASGEGTSKESAKESSKSTNKKEAMAS